MAEIETARLEQETVRNEGAGRAWRAKWIWSGGDLAPSGSYRIFRKTFVLPDDADSEHMAFICADTRYRLYVNGYSTAYGPAPSAPGRYSYDRVSLKYMLRPGENVIALVVNYVGVPMFFYHQNRGGLLFEMGDITSDESWLVARRSPWLPGAPRISVQQGHCEYYDARLEPAGMYACLDIDPDDWQPAVVVSDAVGGPWKRLEPRDIPMAETYYRGNTMYQSGSIRHIEYGNCTPGEAETVAGQMTLETLRPLARGRVAWNTDTGELAIEPDGEDIYVLFDFGQEVSGFLDFDIEGREGAAGGIVDIGYDEMLRVGETPSGMKQDWGTNSNLRYADRLILDDGRSNFGNFAHRAFRYVRLAFRNLAAPVALTALGVYESTYPITWRGTFACSDARLDKIWEIGRRTLQLCMDDRFMDCPWRERAQWVGDAKVEALGAAYCFGDTRLHARFLRHIGYSQHPDGRTDPVGPGEWSVFAPDRPVPGFTCIWIHSIWDYYMLTGDGTLPEEMLPHVYAALDWLGEYGTAQGLLADVPGWNFTDWAPGLEGGNEGIIAPVNLFFLRALQIGEQIARVVGDSAGAERLEDKAAALAAAFDTLFWDARRGIYVDRIARDGVLSAEASQHTNSLALLYEIGSEDRRQSVLSHLIDESLLTAIGSPYFSFYLLSALYKCGQYDTALAYIRSHWGRMLDAGATTWWEGYLGMNSRCHAWSIGPTIDLLAQVLGVTPDEPGFACVRLAPHPCGLAWAKGIVPIPAGDVVVNWQQNDTSLLVHATIPTGVHIRPILPARLNDRILVDGEEASADAIVRRTETEAELAVLPGSGYRFEVLRA